MTIFTQDDFQEFHIGDKPATANAGDYMVDWYQHNDGNIYYNVQRFTADAMWKQVGEGEPQFAATVTAAKLPICGHCGDCGCEMIVNQFLCGECAATGAY